MYAATAPLVQTRFRPSSVRAVAVGFSRRPDARNRIGIFGAESEHVRREVEGFRDVDTAPLQKTIEAKVQGKELELPREERGRGPST